MTFARTRLKQLCQLVGGGTPAVDIEANWADEDHGTAWVSIGDMSTVERVKTTGRRVSALGIKDRRLMVAPPGTLLFSMYASLGHTVILDVDAAWNQAILGLLPRVNVDMRFVRYSLVSLRPDLDELARSNTQANLNAEQVGNLPVSLPALDEQRRIADFLDAETARIDHLSDRRRQQQRLLSERLGTAVDEIFANFASAKKTRLKFLLRQKPRYGVLVPDFVDHGVPLVRVNDLLDLEGRIGHFRMIPQSQSKQYARTTVKENDVLLSVVGTIGRAAIAPPELIGANVARAVCSLRVRSEVKAELVAAWTLTASFREQAMLATGTDTAQPTLGMEDLANFRCQWPNDPNEQLAGVMAFRTATTAIQTAQRLLGRHEAVVNERRQALITAAVTGQFDVTTGRGAELS